MIKQIIVFIKQNYTKNIKCKAKKQPTKQKTIDQGLEYSPSVIDTLPLARTLLPDSRGYGLANLVKYFGITLETHHRAVDDAKATAEVFQKFLNMILSKGILKLIEINTDFGTKAPTVEKVYEGGVVYKDGMIQLMDSQANIMIRNPKLLLQEFTINKDILSRLKMGGKGYSYETGSADIDYTITDPIVNNYMRVEQDKELKMIFYIMSGTVENKAYSYTFEIKDGHNSHAEIISGGKTNGVR